MTTADACARSLRQPAQAASRRGFAPAALLRTTALVGTLAGLALTVPWAANANPAGGSVAAGGIAINQTAPNTLTITQSTPSGIINWQSFNIGADETTIYRQPSSQSVTLNRVTGPGGSDIGGTLDANGMIFIINPNGVVFGPNAQVNVNGLVATTAGISDDAFNAGFTKGRYHFDQPSSNPYATVANQGTITVADGGLAALVAPGVANSGTITARRGRVALGGALTFGLDLYGDGLLYFDPAAKVTKVPVDAAGNPVTALVQNTGKIVADGGTVTLTATAASQVLDQVINTSGVIAANSFAAKNGTIVLSGSGGEVLASGTLDVSGQGANATGGTVKVLGDEVGLMAGATVNASGDAGGGTVLVGGDNHGAGPDPDAEATYVAPTATINADARQTGNGGNVVVWSDFYTNFQGQISAQGGPSGGNGGTVEVSSHGVLNYAGTVDLTAAAGHTGTLLLDPPDVVIENNDGANSGIDESGGVFTPDDSESTSILDTGVLETQLSTASVTVSTQVESTVSGSGGISVLSPLTWSGNSTLTLAASGTITLSAPITSNNGVLVLNAEQNVVMQAPVSVYALTANASGTTGITLGSTVTTLGGGQTYNAPVTLSGNVILTDNDGGDISFLSTIDGTTAGADTLTINVPSSSIYLDGDIGDTVSPGALTFTDAELYFVGDIQVTTAGGAITQTGTTVLESGEGESFVTLSTTDSNSAGAAITFAGPVYSEISGDAILYLYAGNGTVTFDGGVGAASSLGGLQVVGSKINLGPGITISTSGGSDQGGQGYFGAVVLNGGVTMNSTGDSYIYIDGTIDSGSAGQGALTINNDGPVSLVGNIGSGSPLTSLSITAPGGTQLDVGSITTNGGGQTYNTPLLLQVDLALTDQGTGAITFNGTVHTFEEETDPSLTVVTGGPVTFNQPIGDADITTVTVTGSSIAFNASATVENNITAITAGSGSTSNGDITLASGVTLAASGTGNAIIIEAGSDHLAGDPTGGDFINNSGAGALVTPNGNWVVYSGDPVGQGTVDGGLAYTPQFDYDTSHAVSGGNYMLFRGGVLTLTPTGGTATYSGTALDNPTYSDDTANYTISGNPVPEAGLTLSGSMGFNGSITTLVENAGTYALSQGSLTVNSADHLGLSFANSTGNAYVIAPASATVTPNGSVATYNATTLDNAAYSDNLANYTIAGLLGNDTATSAGIAATGSLSFNGSTATAVRNAGTYALGQGSLALSSTNYTLSFANPAANSYVINSASVTLTPQSVTTTYNATTLDTTGYSDNPANYTITGLQGTDTLTLSGSMDFIVGDSPAAQVRNVGTYVLAQGSLAASSGGSNYTINFGGESSYVIVPATVVLTGTRAYDGTIDAPASILTVNGVLGGDALTLSGTGALANAAVGPEPFSSPGTLALGGEAAVNYTIGLDGSSVTITPQILVVPPQGPINQSMQPPQSQALTGVSFTIPFFFKTVLSSQNNTPEDPTLIYSNSGDPGLW